LLKHESLLLNRFESDGLLSGCVEGFDNKANLAMRKATEFREFETIEILLYQQPLKLPSQKQPKDSADEANLCDEHDCIVNTEHIER